MSKQHDNSEYLVVDNSNPNNSNVTILSTINNNNNIKLFKNRILITQLPYEIFHLIISFIGELSHALSFIQLNKEIFNYHYNYHYLFIPLKIKMDLSLYFTNNKISLQKRNLKILNKLNNLLNKKTNELKMLIKIDKMKIEKEQEWKRWIKKIAKDYNENIIDKLYELFSQVIYTTINKSMHYPWKEIDSDSENSENDEDSTEMYTCEFMIGYQLFEFTFFLDGEINCVLTFNGNLIADGLNNLSFKEDDSNVIELQEWLEDEFDGSIDFELFFKCLLEIIYVSDEISIKDIDYDFIENNE